MLWNREHFFNKRWNKAGNSWKKKVVLENNMVSLTRKLCKSHNHFSGKEVDWPGWSFKFGTWINGQYQGGQEVLDWAASLGETAVDDANLAEEVAKHPSATILNQMLHSVLVSLTNMGTTAFELVKNTKPQKGLDAW